MAPFKKFTEFIKEKEHVILPKHLFILIMLLIGLGFSATAAITWEVTNSSDFCGNTCHLMEPQAVSFRDSSHAEVDCTNCHLGVGLAPDMVARKATELTQVYKNLAKTYELPLRIKHLRPARETCEKCHWTKAFYDDKVRVKYHYDTDQNNSLSKTALILKIGGGTSREGKGYGIHWHVENKIEYITVDDLKQDIPWIKATNLDGETITYISEESDLTKGDIEKAEKRTMDCIDCHNRSSHYFPDSNQALDEALESGAINQNIPWVKKRFLSLLRQKELDEVQFQQGAKELKGYYLKEFPEVEGEELDQALATLKRIYNETVYPDADIDWRTYPNNIGHKEFPGCFRCHDGKHVAQEESVKPERKVIRQDCNLCHSIPTQVSDYETDVQKIVAKQASNPVEPPNHLALNWVTKHGGNSGPDCLICHADEKTEGDSKNFCKNTSCHGNQWEIPEVERFYAGQGLYCQECHDMTNAASHALPGHKMECISCHQEVTWEVNTGRCVSCHVDVEHVEAGNCQQCHKFKGERKST